MASYKVYYKSATKHVKVLRATDTAPGNGFSDVKTFNYTAGESYLPYHYVRDAMFAAGILDMSKIIIDVVDEIANVTGISISPATVTLDTSDNATQQLTVTFTPTVPDNTTVVYTSSDVTKATVNSSGLITTDGVTGTGEVTITATSADGGFTDTCVVTVVA